MNHDFRWTTREEKLQVVRYWWREQRGICHLCKDRENPMEPYSQAGVSPWAASIEHLIPKRENGPDTVGNIRLAHRVCNNVLGALWQINKDRMDRGLAPLSTDWALSNKIAQLRPHVDPLRDAEAADLRAERGAIWRQVNAIYPNAKRGTLAYAIETGQVALPRGATLPDGAACLHCHSTYRPPPKLTGIELARLIATDCSMQRRGLRK